MTTNLHDKMLAAIDAYFSASDGDERDQAEEQLLDVRNEIRKQPAQHDPCGWQFFQDGKWHNGMETNNHRANTEAAGVPVRDVYPAQATTIP